MQRITAKDNKRGENNLPYLLLNYIMGRNKSQEKRKNQRKIIEKEARQPTLGRHIHSTFLMALELIDKCKTLDELREAIEKILNEAK
ncbi:MAG: hypothetical protein ACI3XO_05395 [Eubacteriales bacterium]